MFPVYQTEEEARSAFLISVGRRDIGRVSVVRRCKNNFEFKNLLDFALAGALQKVRS